MQNADTIPMAEYYFLQGGGALGALTRSHDWASTSVGNPDTWPQSLRTSVSTVLNAAFPMLLFWGNDMTCFYNDAFLPSLGTEGRHPSVGRKAADMWSDIWDTIGPMLESVRSTGKPVYFEDMLVPFHRDGKVDDTYWTFNYSAVYGESGSVDGVVVICTETTKQIRATSKLSESDRRFHQLVADATMGILVVTGEDLKMEILNDAYGRIVGRSVAEMQDKKLFDMIPDEETHFRPIIESVLRTGKELYLYDQPYFVEVEGRRIEGYLNILYQPYKDVQGTVTGVMIMCHDVTEQVKASQQVVASEQRLRSLINAAPVAIGLFLGRDLVVDMHNQTFIDIVGKGPDIMGKPLREVMPELLTEGQPFLTILDDVYTTGKMFQTYGSLVSIVQNGVMTHNYYNITYSPVYDENGEIYGILDIAVDVTGEVELRKALADSAADLSDIIHKAPVAMGILRGADYRVEIANKRIFEIWGISPETTVGRPIFEALPEAKGQGFDALLDGVYQTGLPFKANAMKMLLPRESGLQEVYVDFVYEALRDHDGKITGVIVVATEVTENIHKQQSIIDSEQRIRSIIEAAPSPIGIMTGKEMRIAFANQSIKDAWGKGDDIIGMTFSELLPELEGKGFYEALDGVYETGIAYHSKNQRIELVVDGILQPYYYNYSYTPLFDTEGNVYGVMNTAANVTDIEVARQKVEESEQQLRSVIEAAPFPISVYTGEEKRVLFANQTMKNIWAKGDDVEGKLYMEILPEFADQYVFRQLDEVYATGKPFSIRNKELEVVENDVKRHYYINHDLTPLKDIEGNIYGVISTAADVTDLTIAKKKVEESEQNLRNMIMQAPVAMCILMGDDHTIDVANDMIIDLWGKPKEMVMGKPLFVALPDAREQGLEALMDMVYRKGDTFKANEMPVELLRNGELETIYQNFVYEPYRDANGNIIGVLVVTIDVTPQAMSRRKVEHSEQRVRSIIDSTPFPIAVYTGPEKTIAYANQSIMDVWGKGNDVVGKTYTEILPELAGQQIFEQVTAVYETGIPFHARNQRVDLVVDEELQHFWFNYSFTPVFDADGKIYGVMNTAAEVTDLNLAKQKIEANEQSLRNIILQAPIAMCIYSSDDYRIEIANEKMYEFYGKRPSRPNMPIFELLPEAKGQGFEEILDTIVKTGKPFANNEQVLTMMRDGVIKPVYINYAFEPILGIDGQVTSIFTTATDVTPQVEARRKIEEIVAERTKELAQANQNLQRSNAELEQFAYIASHDLQEPLRKVSTFTQMLENSLGEIPERSKNYFDKIYSSTGRMTSLIRDVLNYSQLSRDERQAFKPVDLNELVEDIKTDYELMITQKNAIITSGKLPVIEALPQQMSQLFANIISNSLKFNKAGESPHISISAELMSAGELAAEKIPLTNIPYYKIQIRDNGIGFDQAHADKIFNIFQRLHGKAEYSGTGIGLAMCKKIAVNHYGDIYATSTRGQGALFTLILPEKQNG
jgi:PAS domain S-box-containing protein